MQRLSFQRASRLRRKEAKQLLSSGCFSGAYYLAGYAVECGLKACIAKQFKRNDLPDKVLVARAYTHNLEALLNLAGLETELRDAMTQSRALEVNWVAVKDWRVDVRYDTDKTREQATDFLTACFSRSGVLRWIMKRW